MTTLAARRTQPPLPLVVAACVAAWLVAWVANAPLADWAAFSLLDLERGSHVGEAVAFFLLDVPKVLLLLLGIVTIVSLVRSFFPPERVRPLLAGRGLLPGTFAAAGLGIVTPFCSCSAVPLFIGFVEAGVPLGVTFAFLISSPMVNEVALVLLWGLFGPGIAVTYVAAGLAVAIVGGLVIGRLGLERYVEAYVWDIHAAATGAAEVRITWAERLGEAWRSTRELVRRLLPYLLVGIGIGAFIHGYVPTDLIVSVGGRGNPLAVPIVVALGVPMYSNAAGTIPIVEALIDKGLPMGTTLAFMMGVTAISLPELVILRRVMEPQLLAAFVAIVAAGILLVGYLFNLLIA